MSAYVVDTSPHAPTPLQPVAKPHRHAPHLIQDLQALDWVIIAVEPEPRIGGRVVLCMELLELLVREVGDLGRVAAAVVAVCVVWEKRLRGRGEGGIAADRG
eukprot:256190-Chlamydomonas_euryale.AAC.12